MAGVASGPPPQDPPTNSDVITARSLSEDILNADLRPILTDSRTHESIKTYMAKAQTVVSELNKIVLKQREEKQALKAQFSQSQLETNKLLSSLQTQIDTLKAAPSQNHSAPANTNVNVSSKKQKTVQSKLSFQSQLSRKKPAPTSEPNQPGTPTHNKYAQLDDDVENSNSDTDGSESSDAFVDYNSDPEYTTKRKAVLTQMKKKRKRGTTSNSSGDDIRDPASKRAAGEINPSSTPLNKDKKKNILPPPPIKVIGVDNYSTLMELLVQKTIKKSDIQTRIVNNEVWHVNPKDDETAKLILESLRNANSVNPKIQFYTHCNKNIRDLKVIIRGLHPTLDQEEILEDLRNKGFKPKRVICLLKRVPLTEAELKALRSVTVPPKDTQAPTQEQANKVSQTQNSTSAVSAPGTDTAMDTTGQGEQILDTDNTPLFSEDKEYVSKTKLIKIPVHQVDFDHDDDIEKIYKILGICSMRVKVEPIKVSSARIIQCKRCQNFGHSFNFCGKQARCVRCAGKHLSSDCEWPKRVINPKCVNCGAWGHPASYRGCPFAKAMQQERSQALKKNGPKKSGPGDKKNGPKKSGPGGNFPPLPKKPALKYKSQAASNATPVKNARAALQPGVTFADAANGANQKDDLISQLLATIESLRKQLDEMSKRQEKYEQLILGRLIGSPATARLP